MILSPFLGNTNSNVNINNNGSSFGGFFPSIQSPVSTQSTASPFASLIPSINVGVGGLTGIGTSFAGSGASSLCPPTGGDDEQSMFALILILLLCGGLGGQSIGNNNNNNNNNDGPIDDGGSTGGGDAPAQDAPAETTTAGAQTGTVWGDPHFTLGDKTWDVQYKGTANILTDSNVNFNATATDIAGNNTSFITNAGIKIKDSSGFDRKIQWQADGTPTLDGQPIEQGKTYSFKTKVGNKLYNASVKWDGTNLDVNTGEYLIKMKDQGNYFDQDLTVANIGYNTDGVNPEGLWGTNVMNPKNGKTGAGAMGEGVVDNVNNYMVNDIWSNEFAKNLFAA